MEILKGGEIQCWICTNCFWNGFARTSYWIEFINHICKTWNNTRKNVKVDCFSSNSHVQVLNLSLASWHFNFPQTTSLNFVLNFFFLFNPQTNLISHMNTHAPKVPTNTAESYLSTINFNQSSFNLEQFSRYVPKASASSRRQSMK